ncbi:MAG TPA: Kdo hydroxylase family protein, partial [Dongiaceae bacterium]
MSSISVDERQRDYPQNRDNPIIPLAITGWLDAVLPDLQQQAIESLESGAVLYLPQLPFVVSPHEREVLNTYQSRRKNVTLSRKIPQLRDIDPESEMALVMMSLLRRYSTQSEALIRALFPAYGHQLITARVSFRPAEIAGREIDPVYDDRRLHADAFPNQPTRGARILRVFNNINPYG